jgi:hypothetical protein
MFTEQELNNLIDRGTTAVSISSIAQEMMRLSQALEQQAHDLLSVCGTTPVSITETPSPVSD